MILNFPHLHNVSSRLSFQNATRRHVYLNSFSTTPWSAQYGINQFSDLSQKEFRGTLKFCDPSLSLQKSVLYLDKYIAFSQIWPTGWVDCIELFTLLYRSVPESKHWQSSSFPWTKDKTAPSQIWLEGQSSGGSSSKPRNSKVYTDKWKIHYIHTIISNQSNRLSLNIQFSVYDHTNVVHFKSFTTEHMLYLTKPTGCADEHRHTLPFQ